MEKLYTISEVAIKLGVTRPTVYRMIKNGDLVALRIGRKGFLRVTESSLDDCLKPHGLAKRRD